MKKKLKIAKRKENKLFCPVCQENGEKSTIQSLGSSSTLMGYVGRYDEEGNFHRHDRNRITSGYKCSNGHIFEIIKNGSACPSYPEHCDFDGGEEKIRIIERNGK